MAEQFKTIKSLYVASKDGRTKSKIDLTALSKIVDATLANKGIVQLQTEINDVETTAATPKAVNTVKALADANAQKIKDVEDSINTALPGEGSLADKLRDVAFRTKDNQFAESQTIVAKDNAGADTAEVFFKSSKLTHETGELDPGTTSVKAGTALQDKTGKNVAAVEFNVADAGRDAILGVVDSNNQTHGIKVHINKAGETASVTAFAPNTPAGAAGQEIATAKFVNDKFTEVQDTLTPATAEKLGVVKLSDTASADLDAATGGTAVSPKALHATEQKLKAVTDVVGQAAENAALKTAANEFAETQTIALKKSDTTEGNNLVFKTKEYKHLDGTFADGATAVDTGIKVTDNTGASMAGLSVKSAADKSSVSVGVNNADGSKAGEVKVEYDRAAGTFVATAPDTPDGASGSEIVTAKWAKARLDGVQDSLVDATDTKRGLTLLSDAVDSELAAADGKTAATPKAVKTVKDALDAVTAKIGTDAENVALKNAENTFTKTQTFDANVVINDIEVGKSEFDGTSSVRRTSLILKNSDMGLNGGPAVEEGARSDILFAGGDSKIFASIAAGQQLGQQVPTLSMSLRSEDIEFGGIALKINGVDGEVIATAPETSADASGNEIATAKFVNDKVGNLDPTHVAYTNKDNQFTSSQTIVASTSAQKSQAGISNRFDKFDHATGSFDGGLTAASARFSASDKNGKSFGDISINANNTSNSVALEVATNDGAAKSIALVHDRTSDAIKATAPSTDAGASGSEIATADFVLAKKAEVAAALKQVTDVVGQNAENAALINKTNTFAEPQKIQSDGKTLNLGGNGVSLSNAADDALVLGAGFETSKAEIIIAANGSITRTELPKDPDEFEIATVGYVKSLGDIAGSMKEGNWTIAMSDFTQEAHQQEMDEGVFYSVPFNAADQYIQIDPETGKPAETQAEGVTDKKVDHFVIMYKAPTSKLVMNLGERKIAPDFNDVPLLSRDNTFAGINTFKDAQKATPSVDPELGDVNDKSYIAKSELIAYFNKHSPWNNVVTEEPAIEDMVPGQIYFLVEA